MENVIRILLSIVALAGVVGLTGCGVKPAQLQNKMSAPQTPRSPSFDESGNGPGIELDAKDDDHDEELTPPGFRRPLPPVDDGPMPPDRPGQRHPAPHATPKSKPPAGHEQPEEPDSSQPVRRIQLVESMSLRYTRNEILEFKFELPPGSVIEIPVEYRVQNEDYRNAAGKVVRSSTGFITPVKVISVPAQLKLGKEKIEALNRTHGGLSISAAIVGEMEGLSGDFAALAKGDPTSGYLKYFESNGRMRSSRKKRLEKIFGEKLNRGVTPANQDDRAKWQRIQDELAKVANREVKTPRKLLMIPRDEAIRWSKDIERGKPGPGNGAWTIAVLGTAPRNGFSRVPCAEFVSEVIREAYVRAGYDVFKDFNKSRGNQLIWHETAGVIGLRRSLVKAGWVPWATAEFRPPTGAVMMNGAGESPGHAYLAGGRDGRLIIDNGSPQGRDVGRAGERIVRNMYQSQIFLLPPGIQPKPW